MDSCHRTSIWLRFEDCHLKSLWHPFDSTKLSCVWQMPFGIPMETVIGCEFVICMAECSQFLYSRLKQILTQIRRKQNFKVSCRYWSQKWFLDIKPIIYLVHKTNLTSLLTPSSSILLAIFWIQLYTRPLKLKPIYEEYTNMHANNRSMKEKSYTIMSTPSTVVKSFPINQLFTSLFTWAKYYYI